MSKQTVKTEKSKTLRQPLQSYEQIQAANQKTFLEKYKETLHISNSCIAAGISYAVYKRWLMQDADFQEAIKQIHELATNILYSSGFERATTGVLKPLVSHGKIVKNNKGETEYVREYSNTLLLAYLKAHMPEMFNLSENNQATNKGVKVSNGNNGFLPDNMLVLEPSWLEPETLSLIERDLKNHELAELQQQKLSLELQEREVIDAGQ